MKHAIVGLVFVLLVLHQDVWNWNNDRLVFGFLPLTLAYHAGISIAASMVWLIATLTIWPKPPKETSASSIQSAENHGEVVA